jgi:hypothetical protein
MKHICPVCGFDGLYEKAYDGSIGSLEICPCCGFQFGYHDDDLEIHHDEWRSEWITHGMLWSDEGLGGREKEKPANWNPTAQLLNIGVVVSP